MESEFVEQPLPQQPEPPLVETEIPPQPAQEQPDEAYQPLSEEMTAEIPAAVPEAPAEVRPTVPKTEPVALTPPPATEGEIIPSEEPQQQLPQSPIEQPDLHEPEETSATSEGSMANLLNPEETAETVSAELPIEPVAETLPNAPESESPLLQPQADPVGPDSAMLAAPPLTQGDANSDLDVLDELLGKSPEASKSNRTFLIVAAIVVALLIVSGITLIAALKGLGVFDLPESNHISSKAEDASQKYPLVASDEEAFDTEDEVVEPIDIDPPAIEDPVAQAKPSSATATTNADTEKRWSSVILHSDASSR